jgi:hypothetical protein
MAITHSKVSAIADGADTSLVRPSDWNANHVVADGSLTIAATSGLQAALDAKSATSHDHTGTYQPLDTQLTDLAGLAYAGNALNVVRVNAGETAFELAAAAGGTPGGSDTQVQFNNSSAFGGSAGFTYNTTNLTVDLGGGTVTADDPVLDLTQTWNNAAVTFNGIKLDVTQTAFSTSSLLALFRVGGADKLGIWSDGLGLYIPSGSFSVSTSKVSGGTGRVAILNTSGAIVRSGSRYGWSSGATDTSGAADLALYRDAAANLAQRNGTNAQTFRVYNTYTDASNYERVNLTWSSNVCYLKPDSLGTGSARLFVPVTGSTTVGSLPAAATAGAGARSFVTDATATTFLSTVAGGGANAVPVVSDGTNWLIG